MYAHSVLIRGRLRKLILISIHVPRLYISLYIVLI